ncbi:MarR family winged helix-turn-helix transcriptional regulator [Leucobacter luti]|uniref:MarR family transcriptional regulator n=1 Tax=Leucobacter luti TaxID=340320 RepID=A0A4R6S4P7_9MICO|nr:MarR family transcriptional regulator [Leucobacter luti]MCW2286955.1 DNA-binding MarR family transcriptional regulator [Leucobacter luti]TCK41182.1 MarR family transcriptional regulator [Leucobacter luti]TDP94234.1 MarR family transcriptional regulator [Leucobacter luti]
MTEKAPRMTERESKAWLGLINLVQLLPHELDAQLQRDSDLTHFEFTVLSSLYVSPGATLRMTELATDTAATLPRLSHVCTRLEQRGLVERVPCAEDRRATNIRLTSAGRRHFIRAIPEHIELARKLVVDALTESELEALANISETIGRRLADHRAS